MFRVTRRLAEHPYGARILFVMRRVTEAHIRAEHWAPPEVAAGGPNCWLVVGFYDDVAARTPQGWRLSSVS